MRNSNNADARLNRAADRVRDDIDPETTWVVSDNHFGHDNIVGFCHRPLDHDQVMIAEWRKEVPDDGTVVHLGDLSYRGNSYFKHIVAKELTGSRKLLIAGNHDKQRFSFYRDCGFKLARPFSLPYRGHTISFSHYPWNEADDGQMSSRDLRLHGHIHNNGYSRDAYVPFLRQHVNLSLEQTKFKPVNLGILLEAVLFGAYPATTDEQLQEARDRRSASAVLVGQTPKPSKQPDNR